MRADPPFASDARPPATAAADPSAPASIAPLPPLLHLIWLASPALPVGGFSYSEGLEAAVDAGLVTGEATAGDWLVDQLHLTLARSDLPVLAGAIDAWQAGDEARIAALDDWVLATRETSEQRQQTGQTGRSLLEWLRGTDPALAAKAAFRPHLTWPVAFALAASATAATRADVLQAHAFGWAENQTQAAVRAVPLGQSAGQRILQRLAREIPAAVEAALNIVATGDDDARQAFAPMLAILSSRHETQYSRLFRS